MITELANNLVTSFECWRFLQLIESTVRLRWSMKGRFSAKMLTNFFLQKGKGNFTFRDKSQREKGEFVKNKRHTKCYPTYFSKTANHKTRNAQPPSEPEPRNEARFNNYAILGDYTFVRNAVSIIRKKAQSLLFAENRFNISEKSGAISGFASRELSAYSAKTWWKIVPRSADLGDETEGGGKDLCGLRTPSNTRI